MVLSLRETMAKAMEEDAVMEMQAKIKRIIITLNKHEEHFAKSIKNIVYYSNKSRFRSNINI